MSQPQSSNQTKWAGTEDPGEKDSLCIRIDQVYRQEPMVEWPSLLGHRG